MVLEMWCRNILHIYNWNIVGIARVQCDGNETNTYGTTLKVKLYEHIRRGCMYWFFLRLFRPRIGISVSLWSRVSYCSFCPPLPLPVILSVHLFATLILTVSFHILDSNYPFLIFHERSRDVQKRRKIKREKILSVFLRDWKKRLQRFKTFWTSTKFSADSCLWHTI